MVEEIAPKKKTVRGNKERISKLSPEKQILTTIKNVGTGTLLRILGQVKPDVQFFF